MSSNETLGATIVVTWKILPLYLPNPKLDKDTFEYNGSTYNINEHLKNYADEAELAKLTKYTTITNNSKSAVGKYTTTYVINSTYAKNVKWEDDSDNIKTTVTWSIGKKQLKKPVPASNGDFIMLSKAASNTTKIELWQDNYDSSTMLVAYKYTGSNITLKADNYDSTCITASNITKSAVTTTSYTATYTPKTGYEWEDGTTAAVKISWTIYKQNEVEVPEVIKTLTYSGSQQTFSHTSTSYINFHGQSALVAADTATSVLKATDVGEYPIVFRLKRPALDTWSDNLTGDSRTVKWYIARKQIAVPTVSNTTLIATGTSLKPKISTYSTNIIGIVGDTEGVEVGEYEFWFSLLNSNYEWEDGTTEDKSVKWYITRRRIAVGSIAGTNLNPYDSVVGTDSDAVDGGTIP